MPKPARKEALPLNEEDAMEEAAQLKAQVTLSRKRWGERAEQEYREGHNRSADDYWAMQHSEPSANDYKEAIEAVQQIKELAAKESNTKYVLFEMARVMHNLVRAGAMPIIIFDTMMTQFTGQFAGSDRQDTAGFLSRPMIEIDKEIARALTDAEKALRVLENQARKETKKDIRSMKESERK